MARKPREWAPNTTYHVTARGNHQLNIFRSDKDFMEYLRLLVETLNFFKEKSPYHLLSYCLMSNHIHLLISTSSQPLGPFIQILHGKYAIYFNKQYELKGHLFQTRFNAVLARTTSQMLAMSRYIHLNPVAAYMVDKAEDYPYSSYRFLIGQEPCHFVSSSRVLEPFGTVHKYQFYKDYVESSIKEKDPING